MDLCHSPDLRMIKYQRSTEKPNRTSTDWLLTGQEADPPEAGVQRGLDVGALVHGHNDALLQVQPVVGADGHSQQPQAADCKDAAQQCQGLPAACAHGDSGGSFRQSVVKNKKTQRSSLEEAEERKAGLVESWIWRHKVFLIKNIYT